MKTWCGLCLLASVALAACSSTQSDWSQANAANTVSAYEAFLEKHPNTPQSAEARTRIQTLKDEQTWAAAQQVNTVQSYQDYIQEEPSGIHLVEARDRISSNERSMAWAAASAMDTPEALAAFLQKYPQGPEADQAKARMARLTGYRVQLATVHSEKQAEKTRDRLQGKYGDVLGSVVIVTGSNENVRVLQSTSMGQGEANNACERLKKDHLTCEVIKDVNS